MGAGFPRTRAPIAILGLIVLIWGYLFVPGKIGITYSSVFVWSAMRTFPAYVILFILLILLRRPLRPKALGLTALVGVLQIAGFVGLCSAALVTSGAGHTAMLANTWQLWILFMAWLILRERLKGRQWISVGVGAVGLVLIIQPWGLHGVLSSLFAVAAAPCFAGSVVVAKILRGRHEVDLLSLTTWQGLLGSLPLVILAFVFPGEGIEWSGAFIWSLLFSVLIGTALAQVLWLHTLPKVPATFVGLANLSTPIVSVFAAWIQLREQPSGSEIAGMVLIVAALGLLAVPGLWAARSRGDQVEPLLGESAPR